MNQSLLALSLIRLGEAIRKRYAPITGRRALRFFVQVRHRVLWKGPETNREARRAAGQRGDFKDIVAAMRSTERAFKRTV